MKLVRYGPAGRERPGVWVDREGGAVILDLMGTAFDLKDFDLTFWCRWGPERVRNLVAEGNLREVDPASVRLGPPVPTPPEIIAVGKNYRDHAREFDAQIPSAPLLFGKSTSSVIGPHDDIAIRGDWTTVDAEAELGVVIGRPGRDIAPEEALDFVGGFLVVNDVTERTVQKSAGQWFQGKSFDTFCPLGPWLVLGDAVPDPANLGVVGRLNGETLQNGNTRDLIFGLPELIAAASRGHTLRPGMVLATGTPGGVGSARTPPVYLRPGDVVEIEVEGLGSQRSQVVNASSL